MSVVQNQGNLIRVLPLYLQASKGYYPVSSGQQKHFREWLFSEDRLLEHSFPYFLYSLHPQISKTAQFSRLLRGESPSCHNSTVNLHIVYAEFLPAGDSSGNLPIILAMPTEALERVSSLNSVFVLFPILSASYQALSAYSCFPPISDCLLPIALLTLAPDNLEVAEAFCSGPQKAPNPSRVLEKSNPFRASIPVSWGCLGLEFPLSFTTFILEHGPRDP